MNKAQASDLKAIIMIVIVAVLLIILAPMILDVFRKQGEREPCRLQAVFQEKTTTFVTPKSPLSLSACERYNVHFYNDHVTINGDKQKVLVPKDPKKADSEKEFVNSFSVLTEDIVNQVIAEQLRWCWYQFGAGQIPIFESKLQDIGDNNQYCFICNEIEFDENLKGKTFTGFFEYLKRTQMKNSERTYYDYLTDIDPHLCRDRYHDAVLQGENPNCWESYADHFKAEDVNLNIAFGGGTNRYVIFFAREGMDTGDINMLFAYVYPAANIGEQCQKAVG